MANIPIPSRRAHKRLDVVVQYSGVVAQLMRHETDVRDTRTRPVDQPVKCQEAACWYE